MKDVISEMQSKRLSARSIESTKDSGESISSQRSTSEEREEEEEEPPDQS